MKLTTLLLFLTFMQVYAKGYGQGKISLRLQEISIRQLLKEVEKQTDYRFVYHNEALPENKKLTVNVKDAELDEILSKALEGTTLTYAVKADGLVVIYTAPPSAKAAADVIIKGKVTGNDNLPLAGVSVRVSGSTTGTLTDVHGTYSLRVPENAGTLEFSLVGYVTKLVAIENRLQVNVNLEYDVKTLSGVVVTGYSSYSRNKSVSAATTVSSDKINQVPMTPDQILQGRVPGLVVAAGSGQPGQNAKVTIRGVGTIQGNTNVLYVMDGIPLEYGYLQTINPDDIESMTVLKDASAKALYGSKGANGVIVITTKKGKAGKVSFDYKSQYGISNMPTPTFKMLNAAEHLQLEEEIGLETGSHSGPGWLYSKKNPVYATKTPAEQQRADFIIDSLSKVNTDWRKIFLRTGKFMEQQISASGGNENVRFYSSLNFYKQDGIAVRSNMQRYTMRNNLDFTAGKFAANINLSLGYSSSSFIESEGGSSGNNSLAAVYYGLPYEYPYFPDGTLVHSGNTNIYKVLDLREGSNALERLLNSSNKTSQYKSVLSTSLSYTLAPGLVAKTKAGIDLRYSLDQSFVNPDSYAGSRVSPGKKGSFGEATRQNFGVISTSGLTYSKVFAQQHDVEVSGLFEYSYNNYRSLGYTGYGIDGRLPETPAGITTSSTFLPALSGSRTKNAMASYIVFGRYTFNNKYTANLSFRKDGSSTVPLKNRWHNFYSAGLTWDVKRESFLQDADFISGLRLRTSYGTTASPFGPDFGYVATYNTTSYGGNTGIRPRTPGNADYDWEYSKDFNAGFDLSLMRNGRIRIVADVYNRVTSNLFFEKPLSISSGFSSTLINGGAVNNKGVEMDIQGDVVKTKDLVWTIGGNFAYNKNEVTDLAGSDEFENGYTGLVRVGLPLGSHYAPKWAGVDPATGDPQYYNKDGSITTNYNASTQSVAEFGTYLPKVTGGFNTSVNYKGFYANALFSFVSGVVRYNNEDYYNENPSFTTSNQSTRMLYDRWKKPGDIAILQRIGAKRSFSSRDFYDASYVRLRNVNIGYNFPKQVLDKIKFVKGIQVFVQGQNLHTWTKWRGFDPENGNEYNRFSYPSPRTYLAGLNVNF